MSYNSGYTTIDECYSLQNLIDPKRCKFITRTNFIIRFLRRLYPLNDYRCYNT